MPATNDLLNAIVAALKAKFPALKACETHDGRFDIEELKRVATRSPAMYVACLGVPSTDNPGTEQADADALLTIYVVTKSAPQLPRGEAARNLVDALLVYVPAARWVLSGIGQVRALRADNLYSGAVDKSGVALWAVSWRQMNRLGDSVWDGVGVMPTELYVGVNGDEHEQVM